MSFDFFGLPEIRVGAGEHRQWGKIIHQIFQAKPIYLRPGPEGRG